MSSTSEKLETERDFILLLITLYRDSPELWQVKSQGYYNQCKKQIALKRMVDALVVFKPDLTVDKSKKKINALRTNFNKDYRATESAKRSGASADDVRPSKTWYFEEMSFIKDQLEVAQTENLEMDRKLLFKSNIMGNSVMRRNRAAKANTERNLKRKELFSRGRDISESPEAEIKITEPKETKKNSKKAEIAKKEEAYRARFMVYMQEKRQALEQEKKAKKKPPFISAVGGNSTHVATQKAFDFAAPKPVKDISNRTKSSCSSKRYNSVEKPDNKTQVTKNSKQNVAPANGIKNVLRSRNNKINKPEKIKIDKNKLNVQDLILKDTPVVKDKLFVFNNVGSVVTSTARKFVSEKDVTTENFESVFSPIEGIAPLEASILVDNVVENKENNPTEILNITQDNIKSENPQSAEKQVTPEQDNKEPKHFYLSPYVTTSRGKCSAKKERKIRESVYRLELNQSMEEPVEVRRRREAVKYFRQIVSDELKRLNGLVAIWETYKHEHADMFEDHCTDLINVSLGQTKLLIAGKLKQFEKLIDDCEKFANECKNIAKMIKSPNDVSPEDLEGYWNIVKLQIENVDRRFDSLTSWKSNDWKDPDDKVKVKRHPLAKTMKAKVVKHKMKPKNEIKSLIVKAHREFLKNRVNQNENADQDIIFVGRRSQARKSESSEFKQETVPLINPLIVEPFEVTQRRAAIKRFREISNDEAKRLNSLCATWDVHRQEYAEKMEEQCADMINVAIGQTKLLIAGKLKQFDKLVEDCESFMDGNKNGLRVNSSPNHISPEDLEGYWNIVKLQIDNVERRFNNLTSWKNNDWKDPDEVIIKEKKPLTKLMKPKKIKQKVKPRDEVKNLLMKARREYFKSKINNNEGADKDIILVTRRSQGKRIDNLSTPPKSSPHRAPTRYIKTPYRTSLAFKENQTSRVLTPVQRRLSVLKRSSSGELCNGRTPITTKSISMRKSILKSEAKSTQKKSVLFAEQVQYKSPDPLPSSFNRLRRSNGYEASPRIMELRTRKVLLRDDLSDFE